MPDNSSETSGTPGYMAPEVLCAQNHSFPVDFFDQQRQDLFDIMQFAHKSR